MSPCDVPDLALFPPRYPGTPYVRFGAGLASPPEKGRTVQVRFAAAKDATPAGH